MKQKSIVALLLGAVLVLGLGSTEVAFADYDEEYDDEYEQEHEKDHDSEHEKGESERDDDDKSKKERKS